MSRGRLALRYVFFGLALFMWVVNQSTLSAIVFAITGVSLAVGVYTHRAERRRDLDQP
jgi:hypothetical protein